MDRRRASEHPVVQVRHHTRRVDVDFTERSLIAAVGTLEIKDSCGCFRFRATGAHRMGREGIDVWIGVDVTPEMARR